MFKVKVNSWVAAKVFQTKKKIHPRERYHPAWWGNKSLLRGSAVSRVVGNMGGRRKSKKGWWGGVTSVRSGLKEGDGENKTSSIMRLTRMFKQADMKTLGTRAGGKGTFGDWNVNEGKIPKVREGLGAPAGGRIANSGKQRKKTNGF